MNNAGIAVFKPILETTVEDWTRVLATNLTGPFLCTQACAPLMLRSGGGSVVNIASISGVRASTLRVAYGTSKAALIHLTKQQAVELGDAGIRVNCVAPGPVETAMAQQVHSADIRTELSRRHSAESVRHGGRDRRRRRVLVQRCRELHQWPDAGGRRRVRRVGCRAAELAEPRVTHKVRLALRPRYQADFKDAHSHRSATSGSMRDALIAGQKHAAKAVLRTVATAAANVARSVGVTS